MGRRLLLGSFAAEEDVRGAVRAARESGFRIADVYTPYAVHGLDRAMGLRASRLPWVCFALGLFGAAFKLSFQFWAMAVDWPMNVGGKPWNSLPAYVPVTFEVMVLLAGLGVVLAFLLRCRLFPGRQAAPLFSGVTNNRFVLVLEGPPSAQGPMVAQQLFGDFHAVCVEERQE
jgi:hypothetical protein